MLLHLNIRNFAVVPELEQDFLPGFTAISGETGAGKSILVDALGLLLGARSDSSWVRSGKERAELSAEFDLSNNPLARAWLEASELMDEGGCLVRRTIRANGRSNAWINGTPVTVAQLSELGNRLVEVHGQNEHVRLTGRKRQLELLDQTGQYSDLITRVADAQEQWKTLDTQLQTLQAQSALPPAEAEFLRHQLKELDHTALPADQIQALEREHALLASAGDLISALGRATDTLDKEEAGGLHMLGQTLAELEPYRAIDADIDEAGKMLNEAMINAQEASQTLQRTLDKVDLNPARLEQLAGQLSQLGDLARKHRVSLEELLTVAEKIRQRLELADGFEEQLEALTRQRDEAEAQYRTAASALSKARSKHARALGKKVLGVMAELGMQGGQFAIEVHTDHNRPPSPLGDDQAEIKVSANAGLAMAPLSKVASGGELSRISLAIKVVSAGGQGRTQVFDEIDSGVGGDTANAVGRLLKKAAFKGQSLCVTHLAQVAVRADHQLQVIKQSSDDATAVAAQLLDEEPRIEEIARMLGGSLSSQSRAHAREMLESASSTLQ